MRASRRDRDAGTGPQFDAAVALLKRLVVHLGRGAVEQLAAQACPDPRAPLRDVLASEVRGDTPGRSSSRDRGGGGEPTAERFAALRQKQPGSFSFQPGS